MDVDMQMELIKAFAEPSTSFETYGVILTFQLGRFVTTSLLSLWLTPNLWKALEVSYELSMATWHLRWHMKVLSQYLHSKCRGDPVLSAVSSRLHSAVQESRQTSAQGASVAIAAQHRMVLDASPFRDSRTLRSMLLATPYVGNSLFGGQFPKAVEEATRSLEQSSQVKRLASSGSRGGRQPSGQRSAPQQSQKRRAPPPPPPPAPTVPVVGQVEGVPSSSKRRRGKNRRSQGSGGNSAQQPAQQSARGRGVSNQSPRSNRQ